MKVCSKCGVSKPRGEFGPWKPAPDGLKYWCRPCSADYAREYYAAKLAKPQREAICEECGEDFTTAREDQRFCGDRCSRKNNRRKHQQPWNGRRRANYQKRRALKRAAPTAEVVLLAEIRERDSDRCGICGKRVNGEVYPHPLSASLDHVVPLSQGGAHDRANVRLAHLGCNVSRGNRGGNEQLRMV